MRKQLLGFLVLVAALVAGLVTLVADDGDAPWAVPEPGGVSQRHVASDADGGAAGNRPASTPLHTTLMARLRGTGLGEVALGLLAELSEQELRHLEHPIGRMALLEDLVRELKRLYPDTWRAELRRVLLAAFPERAEEMLAMWDARDAYESWVQDQAETLRGMTADERREALWERRRDFFGEQTDELFEGVRRGEALGDALQALDVSHEGAVPDRFAELLGVVEEQYRQGSAHFVATHRSELVNRFLDLNATQQDLAALEPQERQAALHAIRERAGMQDDALARWDALDVARDTRWGAGEAYMRAREEVMAQPPGPQREEEMDALRTQHFEPAMAAQIAHEEAAGFLRFERRRVFGRN